MLFSGIIIPSSICMILLNILLFSVLTLGKNIKFRLINTAGYLSQTEQTVKNIVMRVRLRRFFSQAGEVQPVAVILRQPD